MDISIIISGNLTGFSRFYASPNAKDVCGEAKFGFDFNNYLTFINSGDKAYAISFSAKVIAVSLITRILDSFHRPGTLVVTALVPRGQLVSGTLNTQDRTAIYRLLNEINDRFYEKNFMNGMVNQNPAVLMQDYYSDILSNYTLVGDPTQRPVNASIDVNSPNKRIGYVAANEKDVPKYLSSLMRKSYNGYHQVFFAEKAPANIDEPAEEVITYRVRIENGNRYVPGEVRLTDRIPTVTPELGERPLARTDFTYAQVLNGEAGSEISARIDNDTIVLSFRFPKEEKTVRFKFFDGDKEVPLHIIRPVLVESDGTKLPIPTDTFTFSGKEIYGRKTIKSENSEYIVDSSSASLDLQRLGNDATVSVYVKRGCVLYFDFSKTPRPKTLILTNLSSGDQRRYTNVRESIHEILPGRLSDWEMQIVSDAYETIKIPASSNIFTLTNKKREPDYSGETAKEQHLVEEEKKKRLIQYGIYAVVVLICCLAGWGVYKLLHRDPIPPDNPDDNPEEQLVTKQVLFRLIDDSQNQADIDNMNLALFDIIIESENVKIKDGYKPGYKHITYDAKKGNNDFKVKVIFKGVNELQSINLCTRTYSAEKINEEVVDLMLPVKNSELTSYRDLKEGKIPTNLDAQIARLRNGSEAMREYASLLAKMKDDIKTKKTSPVASAPTPGGEPKQADATAKQEKNRFDELSLTLGSDGESLRSTSGPVYPKQHEKKRAAALLKVMKVLSNYDGQPIPISSDLTERQQEILRNLKTLLNDPNLKYNKIRSDLKGKSLNEIEGNILNHKNQYINSEESSD